MESKHMPFGESRKQACTYKLVTKETEKGAFCFHGNRSWVGCTVGVVCICSILANVVLFVVVTGLLKDVERQKLAIEKISAIVFQHDSFSAGSDKSLHDSETRHKTNSHGFRHGDLQHRHTRKKAGRGRRHLDNQRIQPRPVTQLKGIGDNQGNIQDGGYLLWQSPPPGTFTNSFYYDIVQSSKVKNIRVKTSGIYYVYSQVGLHGKTIMNTAVSECGHEVVRVRRSNTKLLLKTVTTQDNEGRPYPRQNYGTGRAYPLDTQSQAGIFRLLQNDKLLVRISEYCRPYIRVSMNTTFTQFGAFLINEI